MTTSTFQLIASIGFFPWMCSTAVLGFIVFPWIAVKSLWRLETMWQLEHDYDRDRRNFFTYTLLTMLYYTYTIVFLPYLPTHP